jgi:hypothetical protein
VGTAQPLPVFVRVVAHVQPAQAVSLRVVFFAAVPECPLGQAEQKQRRGLRRQHLEYFLRLIGGELRLRLEQARRVRERDFQRADGIRRLGHRIAGRIGCGPKIQCVAIGSTTCEGWARSW